MSTNKYSGLPDIDTAPDVYETEDVFPSTENKADSSDDENAQHNRSHIRAKNQDSHAKQDELDVTSLPNPDQATRQFRRAEHKQRRPRIQYTYPPSPTSSGRSSPEPEYTHTLSSNSAASVTQRLRRLKTELALLEADAVTTSVENDGGETVELIRDIVDAKSRLEKIGKEREGRGRLVNTVMREEPHRTTANEDKASGVKGSEDDEAEAKDKDKTAAKSGQDIATMSVRDIAEMDKRVGELEKIVGASTTAIDETSPLPPPLLPLLTRLSTQLAVLTQPRHIDNISRRLKLLLSDLDRLSAASTSSLSTSQQQQRKPSGHPTSGSTQSQGHGAPQNAPISPTPHTDALAPVLTRLAPLLPHIPQLLTRLRTLSALHTNAALFQSTLESLEAEQRRVHAGLKELEDAVNSVEGSVKENDGVVRGNVKALEERVNKVVSRVEGMELIRAAHSEVGGEEEMGGEGEVVERVDDDEDEEEEDTIGEVEEEAVVLEA